MKLIHIDGSHLYDFVSQDLNLAKSLLIENNGIISIDDYRSPHTLGVSRAIWEFLQSNAEFKPIFITSAKMYITKASSVDYINKSKLFLINQKIAYEIQNIGEYELLRLINNLSD